MFRVAIVVITLTLTCTMLIECHSYNPITPALTSQNILKNIECHVISDNRIVGHVPTWLSGTLYRNGPANWEYFGDSTIPKNGPHWFEGLAMIHGFTFMNGSISYAAKYVKSSNYERIFNSTAPLTSSNTDVTILLVDNHVLAHGIDINAISINSETLETEEAPFSYSDVTPIQTSGPSLAHTQTDPQGNVYEVLTKFGDNSGYEILVTKNGGRQRQPLPNIIPSSSQFGPFFMHMFGLSEHYIILADCPVPYPTSDIEFWSSFIYHEEWDANFIIADRNTGKVVNSVAVKPFFSFHFVNCFEEDNSVICDIIVFPSEINIIADLYVNTLTSENKTSIDGMNSSRLVRFVLPLVPSNSSALGFTILSTLGMELATINYPIFNGRPYQFVYAIAFSENSKTKYIWNCIVKVDVSGKKYNNLEWYYGDHMFPGEPIFVSRISNDASEGDHDNGVVLSVVFDSALKESFLLILNAKDFSEVSRIYLNDIITFGFHGAFVKK